MKKEEKEVGILALRLKQLRRAYSYTQEYVAGFLGVIRQTYSHYETGRSVPSAAVLAKLASLYDISVEELLRLSIANEQSPKDSATADSDSLDGYLEYYNDSFNRRKYQFFTDAEKELLYFFSLLDDADRRELIDFTRIKAKKYRKNL